MRSITKYVVAVAFFSILACNKTKSFENEIVIDGNADEQFSQIVNQLESHGFHGEEVDMSNRRVKTSFKEFAGKDLDAYAKLKEDVSRYDRGRYTLSIQVDEADGGKSKVNVSASVEGYFRPMQATSSSFGTTDKHWTQEASSGLAENEFIQTFKK